MFKQGDMVIDINNGKVGRVVVDYMEPYSVPVDFGIGFNGHDLDGLINTRTGWYCNSHELELVSTKKGNRDRYV